MGEWALLAVSSHYLMESEPTSRGTVKVKDEQN